MEYNSGRKNLIALKPVIIVLFSFLLIMNCANLLFVLLYSNSVFFNGTLISKISIYSSRILFIMHSGLSITACSLILYFIIRKSESRILYPLLLFYLFVFMYPFIIN